MKTYFILIFTFICLLTRAEDTNTFYVTDDGLLIGQNSRGDIKMNLQKVKEAKKLKESLPASEFPEGNWGNVQDGFQLSLRFEKQSFSLSNAITATILLRNVTNQIITYQANKILGQDGPIQLFVIDDNGVSIPQKMEDTTVISSHNAKIYPKTQHKFQEQLGTMFDLKAGESIAVYAAIKVNCPKCAEIQSAKVPIKIRQ